MPFMCSSERLRQLPHGRHAPQDLLAALAQRRVGAAREHAREVQRQRADVLRDRHLVVVQHDQQVGLERPGVVHAPRRPAPALIAPSPITATTRRGSPRLRGGERHAERRADRGARVADAEGVVLALAAVRERRQPVLELDGAQAVAAAGEHLVRVGLVADVPDQPVVRACRRRSAARRSARPCRGRPRNGRPSGSRSGSGTRAARRPAARSSACRQPPQVGGCLDRGQQRVAGDRVDIGAQFTAVRPGLTGLVAAAQQPRGDSRPAGRPAQPCSASAAGGFRVQLLHPLPRGFAGRPARDTSAGRGPGRCRPACRCSASSPSTSRMSSWTWKASPIAAANRSSAARPRVVERRAHSARPSARWRGSARRS